MLNEISQRQREDTAWYHLSVITRKNFKLKVKCIKTKHKKVAVRGWGLESRENW